MNVRFIFFGSSLFSVIVLNELLKAGFKPAAAVTIPDQPAGRGLKNRPSAVKQWAGGKAVPVLTPEKLNGDLIAAIKTFQPHFFITASYGKILPNNLLRLPPRGALNVHPSLLPRYRGPSPVESVIMADDKKTGVSIIEMDDKMDHGPIVAAREVPATPWPPEAPFLEELLAGEGGRLLVDVIPAWLTGKLIAKPQDESLATYTKKISKEDGRIDLGDDPRKNFLKIKALAGWPGVYFFMERNGRKIRVIIKQASLIRGKLLIDRVLPEGKKEMSYTDFLRGLKR